MKNLIKLSLLFGLILFRLAFAQEVQELYDQAKLSLLQGDCQSALTKISAAKVQIQNDANLDPNGMFAGKLLPKLEITANKMAIIITALDNLYNQTQSQLVFPELATSTEAVMQITGQTQKASQSLMSQRDSLLTNTDLEPEYLNAVRKTAACKQVEYLASTGIVNILVERFAQIAEVLADSINTVNLRYQKAQASLTQINKVAAANKSERVKLQKQLADLSEQRLKYLNVISDMLTGESSVEKQPLQMTLMDRNLDQVFGSVITSEISRIQEITQTDSAGFKELQKNYVRLVNYNSILSRNRVAADQAELLAKYDAAIRNIQVVQPPAQGKNLIYLLIGLGILALALIVFGVWNLMKRKKAKNNAPPMDDFNVDATP
jgi:hypothetical protein